MHAFRCQRRCWPWAAMKCPSVTPSASAHLVIRHFDSPSLLRADMIGRLDDAAARRNAVKRAPHRIYQLHSERLKWRFSDCGRENCGALPRHVRPGAREYSGSAAGSMTKIIIDLTHLDSDGCECRRLVCCWARRMPICCGKAAVSSHASAYKAPFAHVTLLSP